MRFQEMPTRRDGKELGATVSHHSDIHNLHDSIGFTHSKPYAKRRKQQLAQVALDKTPLGSCVPGKHHIDSIGRLSDGLAVGCVNPKLCELILGVDMPHNRVANHLGSRDCRWLCTCSVVNQGPEELNRRFASSIS
jgi:hypothetical protein